MPVKALKKDKLTLGYSPFGGMGHNIYPFDALFKQRQNIKVDGFEGVDAVILWGGGEDVHPTYYGQKAHPKSHACFTGPSARDVFEWKTIMYCRINKIPIIGVCLGAQRLCVAAGGQLVQDVSHHGTSHTIQTHNGKRLLTTSLHHQMMNPFNVEHSLLAWSETPMSTHYDGEKVDQQIHMPSEPEIVYFPQVKGFAIQGHPEYTHSRDDFVNYCLREIADQFNFVDWLET